ncbi:universal stress protein [Streptomyces sp. PKU-EA00015]|uniref:universal stress protein n=1 Tax=Streptomyces sp. PKU-EA00015 TaxID=2748326 RepID=UPI0015A004E8|nr:universal stress protein [Streptomyces sp. PKU-EA00015]NWF28757.1 universal stress protein [Streptomyces sp. PKU-EA00015]
MTHVTVGLDNSPESLAAAHWAARDAGLRGADLLLVHVEEWPLPVAVAMPTITHDDHRSWADRLLESAAGELRRAHAGLRISTRRVSGRPPAALALEAADAELLVLGSRGLGTVMGALMGSVGLATIGATRTPVVVVRAEGNVGGHDRDKDVVVGVDLHRPAGPVLSFAFGEAARRGCALRAVHGWKLPLVVGHSAEGGREAAAALGAALLPWHREHPSVEVVERSVMGSAAEVLVDEAADAGLVVVGRHVRHAPLAPHIGHVAHAAMHHCKAPVAVVAHE